jgi:large subunit ribosomal protein L21
MFAIIKTGGKQYKVQEGDILSVEKLPAGPKNRIYFDQVLLIANDQETVIGTPLIEKAAVRADVIEDFKDEKVLVFKKKRRKQFRRTRGHRQELTKVKIIKIIRNLDALPAEEEVEAEKKVEEAPPKKVVPREAAPPAEKKSKKREEKPKVKAEEEKPKKAVKAKKEAPAKAVPKKKGK